ncbi:4568_t:CDS:10, partial [Diversispora eburnea]
MNCLLNIEERRTRLTTCYNEGAVRIQTPNTIHETQEIKLNIQQDEPLKKNLANFVRKQLDNEKKFYDEQNGCFPIICAMFKGSMVDNNINNERQIEIEKLRDQRRVVIMLEIVRWLSEKDNDTTSIFDKVVSDLVIIESFVEAINIIIRSLRRVKPIHGKLFTFLPVFLSTFNTLSEWHESNVLSLAGEFKDIVMNDDQLKFVIEKIMRHFDSMGINGIPPLIYQMLLLSRKGQKNLIIKGICEYFNNQEKIEKAKWISKVDSSNRLTYTPIMDLFQKIIRKTSFGWDQVTQSLVQLCILVMDTTAPSSSNKNTDLFKVINKTPKNANELTSNLGITILFEMFKIHDMVRAEILDQILSRVISKADSVEHFLILLELIVKEAPHSIINYITRIKGALDYFTFLPSNTADRLLRALQPIIYANKSFRRQTALKGYLRLLNIHTNSNCNMWTISQLSAGSSRSMHKQDQNSLSFEIF